MEETNVNVWSIFLRTRGTGFTLGYFGLMHFTQERGVKSPQSVESIRIENAGVCVCVAVRTVSQICNGLAIYSRFVSGVKRACNECLTQVRHTCEGCGRDA